MAATQGTSIFLGLGSGRTYVKDLYFDDVAGAAVNWDMGSGASATSNTKFSPPEPVSLVDVAIVTGAAQTKLQVVRNGTPTGDMLRHTLQLNTLAFRPKLNIPFAARDDISMLQLA